MNPILILILNLILFFSHKKSSVTCPLSHFSCIFSRIHGTALYCLRKKNAFKKRYRWQKISKNKVLCATAERATIRRILCVFRIFSCLSASLWPLHSIPPKTENCAITICAAQKCASSLASKKTKKKYNTKTETSCVVALLHWYAEKMNFPL